METNKLLSSLPQWLRKLILSLWIMWSLASCITETKKETDSVNQYSEYSNSLADQWESQEIADDVLEDIVKQIQEKTIQARKTTIIWYDWGNADRRASLVWNTVIDWVETSCFLTNSVTDGRWSMLLSQMDEQWFSSNKLHAKLSEDQNFIINQALQDMEQL
jgi:hypothetical protein